MKPTPEQIEAFRKEHLIPRVISGGIHEPLEQWAEEENMVLNYLCDLALRPETGSRETWNAALDNAVDVLKRDHYGVGVDSIRALKR